MGEVLHGLNFLEVFAMQIIVILYKVYKGKNSGLFDTDTENIPGTSIWSMELAFICPVLFFSKENSGLHLLVVATDLHGKLLLTHLK